MSVRNRLEQEEGLSMYFAGVDLGSLTAKAVVIEDGRITCHTVIPAGYKSAETAENVMGRCLDSARLSLSDVAYVVSTGYGRVNVPFAQKQITEITCHAKGANFIWSGARTVIDIGGQDSKAMSIDETGRVRDFVMNEKCAAGTGRFLEVMAHALEVDLDDFGKLSISSSDPARISSMCTVFAESEVISNIARGLPKEDIIAGIHDAITSRVASMARRVPIADDVVLTGGVSKNVGVVHALEKNLGHEIHVSELSQLAGALGAALLAREAWEKERAA
jgi:predicted CoA-substrate-specific enzyme activase